MQHDDRIPEMMSKLPREAPNPSGEEELLVARLRADGMLTHRRWMRSGATRRLLQAAAAVVIFVAGSVAGSRYAMRNSLEAMIAKKDLSVPERVLVLQRAGSAYVQAAQSYTDATAKADASAAEVASQILLGAAHAVARSKIDNGTSVRLVAAIEDADKRPTKPSTLWY